MTDVNIFDLPAHPAAEMFPMMSDDEIEDMALGIMDHGLRLPVWLYDDAELGRVVLDGRNRIAACRLAEVEPEFRVYDGDDPASFVAEMNIKRRQLTTSQRAMMAAQIAPLVAADARARQARTHLNGQHFPVVMDPSPPETSGKTRQILAKQVGVGEAIIGKAIAIQRDAPEFAPEVLDGSLTVEAAYQRMRDPKRERHAAARKTHRTDWHQALANLVERLEGLPDLIGDIDFSGIDQGERDVLIERGAKATAAISRALRKGKA